MDWVINPNIKIVPLDCLYAWLNCHLFLFFILIVQWEKHKTQSPFIFRGLEKENSLLNFLKIQQCKKHLTKLHFRLMFFQQLEDKKQLLMHFLTMETFLSSKQKVLSSELSRKHTSSDEDVCMYSEFKENLILFL